MTLATFHTRVKNEINKGSLHDSLIPDKVKDAAKLLERNYTFNYMWRFVRFTIDPNCGSGMVFTMPSLLKKMKFFRLSYDDEDEYRYLTKVDPAEIARVGDPTLGERPQHYWFDANEAIYLDAEVNEEVPAELYYAGYTNWPTDTSQTPTLLTIAEDVLLYQTMVIFGATIRQPEFVSTYGALMAQAIQTLIGSEEEFEQGGQSPSMGYA